MAVAAFVLPSLSMQAAGNEPIDQLNAATKLINEDRLAEAESLVIETLRQLEKSSSPTEYASYGMGSMLLGLIYIRQGKYDEAESRYQHGLTVLSKVVGPTNPALAPFLEGLGDLYLNRGRDAEAEASYKRYLDILGGRTSGEDPVKSGDVLNSLARLDEKQNRDVEAEALLKRAVAVREKGQDAHKLAVSLNDLGRLYRRHNQFAEAEAAFRRALTVQEKAPNGSASAAIASNLGELYLEQKRYADAELFFKRALEVFQRNSTGDTVDVATSLNNLGYLYQDQNRYDEAERFFKRSLAIREKLLDPNDILLAQALESLAEVHYKQHRTTEAEALLNRARRIRDNSAGQEKSATAVSVDALADAQLLLAQAHDLLQRDEADGRAEPLIKKALDLQETALDPNDLKVIGTIEILASLFGAQGRYAEAEPLLKRSLAVRQKMPASEELKLGSSFRSVGLNYEHQGRYADAQVMYERARRIFETSLQPDDPRIARILNDLAEVYRAQGRDAETEPLYARALEIREKSSDKEALCESLNNLAALYSSQSRFAEADSLYTRALPLCQESGGDEYITATVLSNMAVLKNRQAQFEQALSFSTRAVEILAKRLARSQTLRSDAAIAERRKDRALFFAHIFVAFAASIMQVRDQEALAATKNFAFELAQLASASRTADALAGMANRFAAGNDSLSAAIRERQDLAEKWGHLDRLVETSIGRNPAERNPVDEANLRSSLNLVAAQLASADQKIESEFPEYNQLNTAKPVTVDDIRPLLDPDEALFVYLSNQNSTWLWVVRRDTVDFIPIDFGEETLSSEVKNLRSSLDPQLNPNFRPFPATRAFALYDKIMLPAVPVLKGIRRLIIVADGALQSLPFGALVTKRPERDPKRLTDHRDVPWLIHDYAITVLPAVSSFKALRQLIRSAKGSAPFLGIGNPVLRGSLQVRRSVPLKSLLRGPNVDVEAVRQLPALPETETELREIAGSLGASEADLLLGARATEPILRKMPLDRYKVIEFATHGLMSGDLGSLGEPALVLTPPPTATSDDDGLLTASKIATLKLDADWVVLSACNTASSDGTPDAGSFSGLAKAFFYAGARAIMVSHWAVWSKAAVALTTGTFAAWAKDPSIGRAEALRRAMLAMLNQSNPPEFAHPAAWAPFVITGEGGARR